MERMFGDEREKNDMESETSRKIEEDRISFLLLFFKNHYPFIQILTNCNYL